MGKYQTMKLKTAISCDDAYVVSAIQSSHILSFERSPQGAEAIKLTEFQAISTTMFANKKDCQE